MADNKNKRAVDPHNMTAIVDLDSIAYEAAWASTDRSIKVVSEKHSIEESFKTRTEFWGSKRSRDGGWLEQYNKSNDLALTWEDFTVIDIQKSSELAHALTAVRYIVNRAVASSGASRARFYMGGKDGYRLDRSTLQKYKRSREGMQKPPLLNEIKEYLAKKYKATITDYIETDDAITMAAWKRQDRFVVSIDKDACAQPTKVFNPDKPENGIMDCDCFGTIWDDGKEIRGYGRKFLYFQVLYGDDTDDYRSSVFSDLTFGKKAAFKELAPCENDKQALECIIRNMKRLYPEPKEVVGWRGDVIQIDWLYVMNEMLQMARMLRFEGDNLTAKELLDKVKIEY